jgi:putative SOS response-associated peptidase YedK
MNAEIDPAQADFDIGDSHGPGRPGMIVRTHPETRQRNLDNLIWGLLPHGTADPASAPRPIHARAETVATSPLFADAFRRRRAIAPVDAYFQRRTTPGRPQRFAVSRIDGRPMAWAALWEAFRWPNGDIIHSYCVITVPANGQLAAIHDRMPVVLEEEDWPVWLGEEPGDAAALLAPTAEGILRVRPVGGTRGAGH